MEWSAFNKAEEGSKSKQPQVQILEFSHSDVGYKFELVNMNHPHRHDRRSKYFALLSLHSFFVTKSLILGNLNEKSFARLGVHSHFAFLL